MTKTARLLSAIFLLSSFIGCTYKVEKYCQEGRLAYLSESWYSLNEIYSKVIKIDPNNSEAHFGVGLSNLNVKEYSVAITDFTRAIEIDPKNANAFFYRGKAKYYLSDHRGALEDCNKAIDIEPTDTSFYYFRIKMNEVLHNSHKIDNDYSKIIELNPTSLQAFHDRSRARLKCKNYTGSVADEIEQIRINDYLYLSTYISKNHIFYPEDPFTMEVRIWEVLNDIIKTTNPQDFKPYFLRALHYYDQDKIYDINKAIDLNPISSAAYTLRGIIKTKNAEHERHTVHPANTGYYSSPMYYDISITPNGEILYKEAELDLKKALELDPINLIASDYLLQLHDAIGYKSSTYGEDSDRKDKRAKRMSLKEDYLRQLSIIILNDTLGETAEYWKIKWHFTNQNLAKLIRSQYFSKAINKYNKRIEKNSNDKFDYLNRGDIKICLEDYVTAEKDYSQVILLDSKNILAYNNRASVRFLLHNYEGAVADYSKIIDIDPKHSLSYFKRGLLYSLILKQNERGCRDFSKAGELGYKDAYKAITEFCQ